jgi:hypothetical protein
MIRSQGFGLSELTFVGILETDFGVSGQLPSQQQSRLGQ